MVKKQVKKEKKVENGEQNGENNVEADLVVKLPTKKSAAKTETKVEVHKTILPDGTVEEVKTTTTKTTIDGKTEITTKTEKTIIPKEETEEEEVEEEEEEEDVVVQEAEEESEVVEEPKVVVKNTVITPVENGQKETIVKKEERTETSTTKKVVVVQKEESEEEEEEEVEEEPEIVIRKAASVAASEEEVVEAKKTELPKETKKEEVEEEVEEVEVKVERKVEVRDSQKEEEEEEEEAEEEFEEAEDKVVKIEKEEVKEEKKVVETKKEEDAESEYTEEEYESEKEEAPKAPAQEPEPKAQEPQVKEELKEEKQEIPADKSEPTPKEVNQETPVPPVTLPEIKVPLREPSIPLEKVEDVEIKPIGAANEVISKTHTENTEIITSTQPPLGPLSTQTEYNRVENVVTVNRTTKTLDRSYEQITQGGIPTVRTYFAPSRERVGASPQPSKPYQPVYTPEPTTERRHSLLLDRLSMERQIPSTDIYQNNYQYNNQTYEQQRQWSQEPHSEVLNVSNVKPSKITNQQWYQQSSRDNVIYNNVTPSSVPSQPAPAPQWSQPAPQPQQQPQYQPSYTENTTQEKTTTNTYQQNTYPTYIPKPTNWVSSNVDNLPTINTNQYSFLDNTTSESYQKATQQYSSNYVPPPWEQDSNYVLEPSNQNYYQPPPQTNTYTPSPNQGWKPAPPQTKFSKPTPTSYIPPAPNQSFVKPVSALEPPHVPGRKTYYSEYERRYITVPESTYIPAETKFQAQPDPSPQYYYDNNEPTEKVEHEWRKELREFTEKTTSQTQQITEQTSVKPPWEEDPKYVKTPATYTPTPTWSQTLRPSSYRERSFESEFVGSQEFAKTNTLGRSRPLSTYTKPEGLAPERTRGVSVDRYNPISYKSPIPSEYPPAPTHTLTPTPSGKGYHNPNVPAYHAHPRASAEPR